MATATSSEGDALTAARTGASEANRASSGRARWSPLTAVALALPVLFYLPHLRKGFVSEDFLLIALHRQSPPWRDLWATFTEPWLGMRLFEFFRPVATLLFGTEAALFGAWSPGYNVVHVAVHVSATALVLGIVRALLRWHGLHATAGGPSGLRGDLPACMGAMYFGLYPLAPNSVLFAASFANLFGAAATLGATLLYLRSRERASSGSRARDRWPFAAFAVFAVAMLCYESSVLLPLWLGLLELSRAGASRRSASRALLATAPFFALALVYLGFRAALFGEALGGYEEMASRLRAPGLDLAQLALRGLLRLPSPWFEMAPRPSLEASVALLLLAAAALWTARGAGGAWPLFRLFGVGIGWILVFQAPFSYELVSPGNGRYWYLPAAGAAMALASVIERAAATPPGASRRRALRIAFAGTLVALLVVRNAWLLQQHLGWMDEAASEAASIAAEIRRVAPKDLFFVADHPAFVQGPNGTNRAQVYHYGLRAAVGPPFVAEQIDVYPLPPRAEADPRRLALERAVFRWSPENRLVRLAPRPAALPPELPASERVADAGSPEGEGQSRFEVEPLPQRTASLSLVAVAPGNSTVVRSIGTHEAPPAPEPFLRLWDALAPGPQLWWLEARDDQGRTLATSRPQWFRRTGEPR